MSAASKPQTILVAVWPGMGQVALTAGYYLMAKLGMYLLTEFSPRQLFDMKHVEVRGGLVRAGRLPRSRLFKWSDSTAGREVILFIGEAQPPTGNYEFCKMLVDKAREFGVERVFTFAAMATAMRPDASGRVFGAATDQESLEELKRLELEILEEGHIGGLDGVLLGIAAEEGMSGSCLLGEIPQIFSQLPYPRASLAVLEAFSAMVGIEIDLSELSHQAEAAERQLGELYSKLETAIAAASGQQESSDEPTQPEEISTDQVPEAKLDPRTAKQIERLFEEAASDRSKAYELKTELDRLGVFRQYEDRFLDLFKMPK